MIRGWILAVLLTAACMAGCSQSNASRPNVVLIVADDLGWADVGYHGGEIRTPHIDSLVRDGIELDRFYAFPVCSPSRAALLTGRSAIRHGLCFASVRPASDLGLPLDETTLGELLQAQGYRTACVGKWHLGHTVQAQHPNARGFEHFYGHLNGYVDYDEHTRLDGIDWQRNGKTVHEPGYATDLVGTEAARVISEHDGDRPLFLYVPFLAPHLPLMAPAALEAEYASIADPRRRTYAAMVDSLDRNIGLILQSIADAGIEKDTLVLFLSDNGGDHKEVASNAPLLGGKHRTHEGGVRVVAAARWPGQLTAGEKCEQFTSIMDVLPTLAQVAGVPTSALPEVDGLSRWAQWTGAPHVDPKAVVFATGEPSGPTWVVYDGPWKLFRAYLSGDRMETLLLRYREEPPLTRNMALVKPAIVERLLAHIEEWQAMVPEARTDREADDADFVAPTDWAAALRD